MQHQNAQMYLENEPVPVDLEAAFEEKNVLPDQRFYWRLWIRKYLGFCSNINLDPCCKESVSSFISTLKNEEREPWQCSQAEDAVELYLSLLVSHKKNSIQAPGIEQCSVLNWEHALERMTALIAIKHCARSTKKNYTGWIRRFQRFINGKAPGLLRSSDVAMFVEHIVVVERVSASSQNLAFNALLFLYKQVLTLRLWQVLMRQILLSY